jgi:hypothetical protein
MHAIAGPRPGASVVLREPPVPKAHGTKHNGTKHNGTKPCARFSRRMISAVQYRTCLAKGGVFVQRRLSATFGLLTVGSFNMDFDRLRGAVHRARRRLRTAVQRPIPV